MKALILLCLLSIGIILNIQCKPSSESGMAKTYNQRPIEIQVQDQDQDQASENNEENNSQRSGELSEGNEEEHQFDEKDFRNIPEETENAEVKQLSSEDEKTKKEIEKFGKAFTKVLTHTLLLTVGPQGHVFGIVTTILLYSSGMMGGKKSDLWSQLKERIKVEVGKGLAEYHFHQTKKFRLDIEHKIAKKDRLTVEHWDEIIARNKFDFFPQTNPATGYDERLCLLPVAWVTYMVAALGQLENLKKVPRCSVANELKKVKEDLRHATKEMFRKRYKAMSGIDYWEKGSSCSGRFMCSDTRTWNYQMVDGTTDEKFVIQKSSRGNWPSWSEYSKYKTDTVDVVWNNMINKINDFFTADICREGCECPTPLRKDEITWSYVSGCYGKLDETDYCNQCDTPCKNYGESYTWCGCTEHDLRKTWTWDYCRAANWDVCRGETPYPFQRAKEFEDSREKKKKMKKQKTE